MTESSTFDAELSNYNSEIENNKQENLLNQLKTNPEDFTKLFIAELGFPVGLELTEGGLNKFYKSSGLEVKVNAAKEALKEKASNFLKPYKDRLSEGIDTLKGYFSNGVDAFREKGQSFIDDSLTGLKGVVTGAAKDKLTELEGKFNQLKADVGGRYKDAVDQLETLKRQGIEEGSSRYKAAVQKAESLKQEFSSRVEDLQSQATDTLQSAQTQIEEKAKAVGDSLKGKAQGLVSSANSKVDAARAQLEDIQSKVAQGASELGPQLEQAKSRLQAATEDRVSQLQKLSPEVLQSVQEGARLEYLQAQSRLNELDPEEPGYTDAASHVQAAQQRLSGAVKDLTDRASSLSSLGQDALSARKASALNELESARNALRQTALQGADDVGSTIKAAQDRLIEAQTAYRGALVDLGENVEGLGSRLLGGVGSAASGLGEDLFGALPAIGLDLANHASISRLGEDTGIATGLNRGIGVVGNVFGKARDAVKGLVTRYQNLTPKVPTSEPAADVEGGVDTLGGDIDALAGDTVGTVKSLSSTFVRTGRPSAGFLQQLFGDVTSKARSIVPDELLDGVDKFREGVGDLSSLANTEMTSARSLASTFLPKVESLSSGVRGTATSFLSQAQESVGNLVSQSQSLHQAMSSNIARATEVAGDEEGVIGALTKATGLDTAGAIDALATKATAVQGGELEGGLGELAEGALGAAADVGEAVAGGAEAAGEAIAESTGETGIGAIVGGLGILGGVLYDMFGTHEAPPPVIPIPNYSIPVFAPGGH